MNEKIKEINEKAIIAYKQKNIYELINLYGIEYFNGALMSESLNGFNKKEVNNLYEKTLIISRRIYSFILDVMLNIL